jgi:integrating conjugative element protein (TIGR03765 family)
MRGNHFPKSSFRNHGGLGHPALLLLLVLLSPLAQAAFNGVPGDGNTAPLIGAANFDNLLPIRSPGLTPGTVQARTLDITFSRPLFLIGSDHRSRRWLQLHRSRLLEIGAVGMLVQAETISDLKAIADLANGLTILPASATDIARAVGVAHYPVLLSSSGIEQ